MPRDESYPSLISLAVHELRTPASVVGGYLRMLQHDTDPPLNAQQKKMIAEAEKSCARLVTILAELSDIGKLDSGQTALANEKLDLFPLVHEVAERVHEAEDRDVRLRIDGLTSGAPLSGDSARLRLAFDAVFRAILREQPGPSTVVGHCSLETENGVRVAVVGIADEEHARAAFHASREHFNEKRGGLGLGLPLARRAIEAHGGQIWSPLVANRSDAAVIAIPLSKGAT